MVVGWDGGDYGEKREEVELMERLISTQGCRREILEEYLDRLTGQVYSEGDAQCDGYEGEIDIEISMETSREMGEETGRERSGEEDTEAEGLRIRIEESSMDQEEGRKIRR